MKHLDLFSGIGGFSLALDRVWHEEENEHTFCEIDPFCQAVLKKHWPSARYVADIRQLTLDSIRNEHTTERGAIQETDSVPQVSRETLDSGWTRGAVDVLTGGFPCQPFSQAGLRKGTEDDRHLWPEMLRVIREFHPRWVIGENVGGFVTWSNGLVLEQVHTDLESEGYAVQAFIIPAVAVNAPHRRDRVWIVAHSESAGDRRRPTEVRGTDGGQDRELHTKSDGADKNAQNTISERGRGGMESHGQILERESTEAENARPSWEENWVEVATRLCRVDDGVPRRMDRNPRLKALGNAIVPAVAEEIMRAIRSVDAKM